MRHRQVSQCTAHHHQRDKTQRQVDPEDPAPRQVVRQITADHRAGQTGHGPHAAHVALVAATLAQRHHVGNGGLRHRDQPATAQPLQHARHQQHRHAGRQRACHGRQHEQCDRRRQHGAAAIQVTQFSIDGRNHGGGHEVGRHQPRHQRKTVELPGNDGQCHRDNRLLQCAQQDGKHQAAHHHHHRNLGHRRRVERGGRRRRHGIGGGRFEVRAGGHGNACEHPGRASHKGRSEASDDTADPNSLQRQRLRLTSSSS